MWFNLYTQLTASVILSMSFFLLGRKTAKRPLPVKMRKMMKVIRVGKKGVSNVNKKYDGAAYVKTVYDKIEKYFKDEAPYLNPDLMLKDIAIQLYTNKQYIAKAIKIYGNMNFSQFVNSYRIRYAVELFQSDPSLRVNELAFKCGFNSSAAFTLSFKIFMNMPPGEWCRNYKVNMERNGS